MVLEKLNEQKTLAAILSNTSDNTKLNNATEINSDTKNLVKLSKVFKVCYSKNTNNHLCMPWKS